MSNLFASNSMTNSKGTAQDIYKSWREKFVTPILVGSLIFGLIIIIPAVTTATSPLNKAAFIIAYAVTLLITLIPFPYPVKMSTFLAIIYMLGINELMSYGILGDSLIFFLALIVFATMMFSPRAGIATVIVNLLTFAAFGWLTASNTFAPLDPLAVPSKPEDWFITGGLLALFSLIIILGFQRLEADFSKAQKQVESTLNDLRDERNNLDNKVSERTKQLRRVNEIGRQITSILDPDELLARSAQLIGDEFECYYAAIYLLDITGRWAEIKEATGEAGKVLRENRHRLDISGRNLVSIAIRTKQIQIAQDATIMATRAETQLLPYTRSQIAMPLIVRERALGALELHSSKSDAFSEQDEDTFLNLANEIAIALENSRLFREAQQTLAEMRATQRQYLQSAWLSVATEQDLKYEIGDRDYAGKDIQVALALRDQIIGQIEMSSEEWTQEQKNLIESIATQAALALENARLVEESQSIATRERLANEIIAKVWSSATMDAILQTTVRELGRALEAAEVDIEVSMAKRDE
jgi:GAF domain-containing protein